VTSRDRSDAELLVATAGEPEAFGAFYRRHVTAVLAYLISRTGRRDLAADVCDRFRTGEITLTSRFTDGTTTTERIEFAGGP
jgi:hypothetical protein